MSQASDFMYAILDSVADLYADHRDNELERREDAER